MKITEMNIEQLEEYIDDLKIRLAEGSDERNEIELVNAEISRKRGLKE